MHKIALVIFSKHEGSGNSAIYSAMMFAQELQRAGDDRGHAGLRALLQEGRQIITV